MFFIIPVYDAADNVVWRRENAEINLYEVSLVAIFPATDTTPNIGSQ